MSAAPPLHPARARRAGADGFTLVEVLVALAIVALLLLSSLALYALEANARRRLAAHAAAERALVTAYEELRGGLLPLETGPLPLAFEAESGALALAVESTDTGDLYRVRLVATYRATGRPFRRTLEALLWRP
jgi:prepilin-type N-terminal cleavage/methylation domain-containing protein